MNSVMMWFIFSLKSILHPMDEINQRYPRKRALYLAGLAQQLCFSESVGSLSYSCLHGNRLRPVLLLKPPGTVVLKVACDTHSLLQSLHWIYLQMLWCQSSFHGRASTVIICLHRFGFQVNCGLENSFPLVLGHLETWHCEEHLE